MKKLAIICRGLRRIPRAVAAFINRIRLKWMLFINQVQYVSIHSNGLPYFCVATSGSCRIGSNFYLNNGLRFNPIGYVQPCTIYVNGGASLTIGNHVGLSQASIICHHRIVIEDYVKIGGGGKIYDTDFHSLRPEDRLNRVADMEHKVCKPVILKSNCFIGAGSIVLKGVTVGRNSIVGAGSVVTRDIPDNEIWGGSPAKFIKRL